MIQRNPQISNDSLWASAGWQGDDPAGPGSGRGSHVLRAVRGDGRKTGPKTDFLRHRILKSQLVLIDQFSPWKNCKTGYIMYRSWGFVDMTNNCVMLPCLPFFICKTMWRRPQSHSPQLVSRWRILLKWLIEWLIDNRQLKQAAVETRDSTGISLKSTWRMPA